MNRLSVAERAKVIILTRQTQAFYEKVKAGCFENSLIMGFLKSRLGKRGIGGENEWRSIDWN